MSHIIYNEDCLETMKKFNKNIDLILTSPPYNMTSRKGGNADTGRYDVYRDWKTEEEYIEWTIDLFLSFDKILKSNRVILYNFSYSIENPILPYKLLTALYEKTDFTLADTIIWKKRTGLPFPANERKLSRNWEYVWVICRKSEMNTFECHKGITKISAKGQKYYNVYYNFIEANNNDCATKDLNQATFSSDLCLKLFDIYAGDGYTVFDPFMGTGTTAYACELSNKNLICYGSEISKKQCEYAENRLKEIDRKTKEASQKIEGI